METSRKRTRYNVPDPSKRRRVKSLNDIRQFKEDSKRRLEELKVEIEKKKKEIEEKKKTRGITKPKSKKTLRKETQSVVRMERKLREITSLINLNKEFQTTNFDFKPSYISAIKTGTDLLYQSGINIKKERLVEIFLSDVDERKKFSDEAKQEEFLINNFLKCSLLLLDIDDLGFDIKENKKKLTSKMKSSTKGGAFSFTPSPLIQNFLNYQYIFDNYHDFNDYKEIPDEYFYKTVDIQDGELKKLYGLREPIIFSKIITQSPDILDDILYFSIYNFVNYQKEVDEIIGKIMVKNQKDIDLMKTNIEQFLKDIMGVKEVNYVVDMKINFGNMSNLSKFGDKLKSLGVITNVSNLLNESSNWELIKKQIIDLFSKKRFYTLEDIFDSAPLNCEEKALKFLNDKIKEDEPINALGYISHLIFGNEDFGSDLQPHKNIFKAFKENIRDIFNVVYYKEGVNDYRVALIFKNKTLFEQLKRHIPPSIIEKFINLITVSSSLPYLYKKHQNGDYAIDICKNQKKIVFEIKNVVNMIKKLVLINKIKEIGLKDLNNIIATYVAYCIYPHMDTDLTPDKKKEIARAYFDLKKSGDIARILFVFFYNYLKKNNINNDTMKHITNDICYTGNDKLADLNSIIRKGNNVIFPDTANYSICLFNINNKDYSFKDFYISTNIYFISKFISNNFDIFQYINDEEIIFRETRTDEFKRFNNIIRNISYEKILLLKDNVPNTPNIYNEVKKQIKKDFMDFMTKMGYDFDRRNIKKFLIEILNDCEIHIKEPSFKSKVSELLTKVNRVIETDIFKIANEIDLTYTDCNYNHKEIENELLDKLEKIKIRIRNGEDINTLLEEVNNIKFKYFYIKFLHFLTLLNDISKYETSFNINLNKYMKYILFGYLTNVSVNIKNNLENVKVISYFSEKVIFNKVEIDHKNRDIFYNITKRVLDNINKNNNEIIIKFKEIIEGLDDTENKLLNPQNLKKLFMTIHNYLKIIDTFVFYIPPSDEDNPNPSNIHECITNFNKYIFDLLAYKKNVSKQDKFKINFYTLINDPNILRSIFSFEGESGFTSRGANIKSHHLIKNFFKNIDNINYIIFFNNFYDLFDTVVSNNKLLDVDMFPSTNNFIQKIISQIKSIYTYSYINIYNTANTKDYFHLFFENIKETIAEKKASIIAKLEQNIAQNQDKIEYFKKVIEKLENSITSNETIFINLDKKMKERYIGYNLKEIGYYLDFNDDIRERVQYDYKVKVDIPNREITLPIISSIQNEDIDNIPFNPIYTDEINKIIKIFNFFLSFK